MVNKFAIIFCLFLLFALFYFTGTQQVEIVLFPMTPRQELPLWLAMLVFFTYGVGAAGVLAGVDLSRTKAKMRKLKKEKAILEKEVASLRDLMVTEPEE